MPNHLPREELVKPAEPVEETPVVDLMDALKKSVAEVSERKPAKRAKAAPKSGSRKRVAARKSA